MFVFCTDGIFEAMNEEGDEFGARRVCEVVRAHRHETARAIVDAIFDAVDRVPRSRAAERRHDGGGGEDYGVDQVASQRSERPSS